MAMYHRTGRSLAALATLALAIVLTGRAVWPLVAAQFTSAQAAHAVQQGYPGPSQPTATPAPDAAGVYAPPSVPYDIVVFSAAPHAALLTAVRDALAAADTDAMAAWSVDGGPGLLLEYPGASEGFGAHLPPASVRTTLDALYAAGSRPVVQGYFEQSACDPMAGERPCWPWIVITGLEGVAAMPTRDPRDLMGPPIPAHLPLGAAAWEIVDDATGPYWRAWWLGDGYYDAVERIAEMGFGTYHVLR